MLKLILLPLLALTATAAEARVVSDAERIDYAVALHEATGDGMFGICDLSGLARDGATLSVDTDGAMVSLVAKWPASADVEKELHLHLDSSYRHIQRGEITTTVYAERFVNEGDLAHPRIIHRRAGRSMTTSCL